MERGYQEVSEAAGIAPASSGTSSLTRGRIHSLIRRAVYYTSASMFVGRHLEYELFPSRIPSSPTNSMSTVNVRALLMDGQATVQITDSPIETPKDHQPAKVDGR